MSDFDFDNDDDFSSPPPVTVPSPIPPWSRPVQSPLVQTCTGDDTISLTMDTTYLEQNAARPGGGPYQLVLPDGNFQRQIKRIYVAGDRMSDSQQFKVMSGNFFGFGWLLLSTTNNSTVVEWDGFKWHVIGGNALQQS